MLRLFFGYLSFSPTNADQNFCLQIGSWIEPLLPLYGIGAGVLTEEFRLGGGGKMILMDVAYTYGMKHSAAEVLDRFHDLYLNCIKPMANAVYNYWGGQILRPKNELDKFFPKPLNHNYQTLQRADTNKWLEEYVGMKRRKKLVRTEGDIMPCPLPFAYNVLQASRANLPAIAASQRNNKRLAIVWRWAITHRLLMGIWLKGQLTHKPALAQLRRFMLEAWTVKKCVVNAEFVDGGGVGPTEFPLVPEQAQQPDPASQYLNSGVAEAQFLKQSRSFIRIFQAVQKTAGFKKPNPQKLMQRVPCSEVKDILEQLGQVWSGLIFT